MATKKAGYWKNHRKGVPKIIQLDPETIATLETAAKASLQGTVKPYIEEVLRQHAAKLREGGVV